MCGRTHDCKRPLHHAPHDLLRGGGHPHMNRRGVLGLLAGAAMSLPPATEAADGPSKVFRLGAMEPGPPGPGYRAMLLQLFELGYEEGRNLRIDYVLFDSTDADRSLGMATELVNRGVDAILAVGTEVALKSAVAATKTIPIVIQANDYDPLARAISRAALGPVGTSPAFSSSRSS